MAGKKKVEPAEAPKSILTPVGKKTSKAEKPVVEAVPELSVKRKRRTKEQIEWDERAAVECAKQFEEATNAAQVAAISSYVDWTYTQVTLFHAIDSVRRQEIVRKKKDIRRMRIVVEAMQGHLQSMTPSHKVVEASKQLASLLEKLQPFE